MSTYFRAAERCGLRANVEEMKRAAHRTVAATTPSPLLEETTYSAQREADTVASTGARRPTADVIVLAEDTLPFADDRKQHHHTLLASEEDIIEREKRDRSDFEQREKVERLRRQELEEALEEERQEERRREEERNAREAAARLAQETTKQRLRDTYGPCFLWNDDSITAQAGPYRTRESIESSVEKRLNQSPWIERGLELVAMQK